MIDGAEPSRWFDAAAAARALCVSDRTFEGYATSIALVVERRSKREGAKGGAGNGWLWHGGDIERLARIRRECRIGVEQALRVATAMREGRI